MKHKDLRSVAHNIADSLASGIGLLIGGFHTDIFGEARKSSEKRIIVDFLNGSATGASSSLAKAVRLYSDALPELCERQGVSITAFKKLTAEYFMDAKGKQRVVVEINDQNDRSSKDEYVGVPLKRIMILDGQGRIRRKPTSRA